MKYRVEFEFMNTDIETTDGLWHKDYLDNNGSGFDYEDASDIAMEMKYITAFRHKNIKLVEMEGIQ